MKDYHHYSVTPHEMAGSLRAMAGSFLSMSFTRFSAEKRGRTGLLCVQRSCDRGFLCVLVFVHYDFSGVRLSLWWIIYKHLLVIIYSLNNILDKRSKVIPETVKSLF